MSIRRFSVKYFVQGDFAFDLDALIPIYHRWIQQHALEGLLLDVADYKHVFQGPGILLIGHEGDYGFDLRKGRAGLRYSYKRGLTGNLSEDLQTALRRAADAARKLEGEESLNGLRFDLSEVEITFEDRLNVPNTPEAFAQIESSLHDLAASLYQTSSVQVESVEADPRKLLTVRLSSVQENVVC